MPLSCRGRDESSKTKIDEFGRLGLKQVSLAHRYNEAQFYFTKLEPFAYFFQRKFVDQEVYGWQGHIHEYYLFPDNRFWSSDYLHLCIRVSL